MVDIAPHIQKLYDLLGENTVLLPVPREQKGPRISGWQKTTLADTASADYQKQLAEGNVGVLLGGPSDGLCAIDIDDDALVDDFLKINAPLRGSLTVRGARGVKIFVRCKQDPKAERAGRPYWPSKYSLNFPGELVDKNGSQVPMQFGEWLADGSQAIVYGVHPSGNDYELVVDAPVRSVNFTSINWPSGLSQPWKLKEDAALREIYGDPWVEDNDGNPKSMIETYWAGLFAAEHDVIYEADEERYYLYNEATGVWEKATDQVIKTKMAQMLLNESRSRNQRVLQQNKFRSSAKLGALSEQLKGICDERQFFKPKRGLIHLKNGMLDLTARDDDGALHMQPFSPEFRSRNQIPVAFDAEADCPKFKKDLLGRALAKDDIRLLQRWGGLLLLQDNVYQKIMILTGTAGGGKSTVMSVFQKMVGTNNCAQLRTEQLLERFEMGAFIGKTALFGGDVPGNFLMEKGAYKIKQLTGGDLFDAELKAARDFVKVEGRFNMGITCNSRLRVAMDSDAGAYERRLCIIKYEAAKPENPVPNFDQWLFENEGPGILNWMIEGAIEILEAGKFQIEERHLDMVKDLLEESDSVRSFLRRFVVPQRGADVTTEELVKAYTEYCDSVGWTALGTRKLENQLPDLMLELFKVNKSKDVERPDNTGGTTKRRGWLHVKLLTEEDAYDED